MDDQQTETLRKIARPCYLVAILLVATPMVDFITNVWPIQIGAPPWRFGSFGLLSGFFLTPILGVLLAMGAAIILEDRLILRTISILIAIGAVLILVICTDFILDTFQMRNRTPPEAIPTFDVTAWKAVAKFVFSAFALAWLAAAGWRGSRGQRTRRRETGEGPLISTVRPSGREG